ncbi:MAG: sugar ABC transporter substrate-binding protein [Bifidobacteriaceae bacterium]|jgi:multiple sugar transport system substrate-binding protein|nr:sugar ABC transporter substrate-binding protein [Bifidobacteriaceae bacterium]
MKKVRKSLVATLTALAMTVVISACSNDSPTTEESSDPATSSAGEETTAGDDTESGTEDAETGEQTTITVWAWEPTLEDVVPAFEAANPDIKVDLQNVGGAGDTYTKLDNAIAAGSGGPDISQVEYYAVAQYALPEYLADLTEFGADALADTFTPGTWNAVTMSNSGSVYGLPVDSGPMALFYNKDTFDEAGVSEPPATWDEFYEAAQKVRALGENYYITSDNGDAGLATSMMWLAGGHPFEVGSDSIAIDLGDAGVTSFAEFWQKMIDEDLINTTVGSWSDDWFKGLGDGTLASLMTGAWMPANLIGSAPEASGNFRVAAMPVPEAGSSANSENGGSSLAILASSENREAAYRFLEFTSAGEGAPIRIAGGNFPSRTADLEDADFLAYTDDYFGGQAYNEILGQAAADVLPGWSYLPFQVYANSVFGDKMAGPFSGSGTLTDAYASWQEDLVAYGNENGFNVQ